MNKKYKRLHNHNHNTNIKISNNEIELGVINHDKKKRKMSNNNYIDVESSIDDGASRVDEKLLLVHDDQYDDDDIDPRYDWRQPKINKKRRDRKRKARGKGKGLFGLYHASSSNKKNSNDDVSDAYIQGDLNDEDELDEETYQQQGAYQRLPMENDSYVGYDDEDEETEIIENLSNTDYYYITQDEIPFRNLRFGFTFDFIRSIFLSTRHCNTYQKEIRKKSLISTLAVGAVAIIYFLLAVYISLKKGYTTTDMHDINDYTNRSIFFSSLFLLFTSAVGITGIRYKYKPILSLYLMLIIMASSFHFYSVKQIHNSLVHSERIISFAWWDKYTPDVIIKFEEKVNK